MKQATSTFISDVEEIQEAIRKLSEKKRQRTVPGVTLEPKTTRNGRP